MSILKEQKWGKRACREAAGRGAFIRLAEIPLEILSGLRSKYWRWRWREVNGYEMHFGGKAYKIYLCIEYDEEQRIQGSQENYPFTQTACLVRHNLKAFPTKKSTLARL